MTVNLSGCWEKVPGQSAVVDLSDLEGTSLYCDSEASERIRRAFAEIPLRDLHLIDTGDYHYLTYFFIERINEPFELVLFDNHPDNQPGAFDAGLISCGNWVLRSRNDLPFLKRVSWYDGKGNVPAGGGDLPVYISIDLDILAPEYVRTGWDQGNVSVAALLENLKSLGDRRLLGADICGGSASECEFNRAVLNAVAAGLSSVWPGLSL